MIHYKTLCYFIKFLGHRNLENFSDNMIYDEYLFITLKRLINQKNNLETSSNSFKKFLLHFFGIGIRHLDGHGFLIVSRCCFEEFKYVPLDI